LELLVFTKKNVKLFIVHRLGKIGDAFALPALMEALKDKDNAVREKAAEALRLIGTPEALKEVEEYQQNFG